MRLLLKLSKSSCQHCRLQDCILHSLPQRHMFIDYTDTTLEALDIGD